MTAERFVVVVGIDFTPESEHALAIACAMAERRGASSVVHAVHAVPLPALPAGLDVAPHVDLEGERHHLDRIRAEHEARFGVAVEGHLMIERPERALASVAESRRADLVVVGTHERRGIARLLHSSTTDRVVHAAPCSVLVARPPPDDVTADDALESPEPAPSSVHARAMR